MTPAERPQRIALTALYVPGDRPDRIAKALTSGADIVIVDLEDAVAAAHKAEARAGLSAALAHVGGGPTVQVRVNARGSAWHDADLAAVAELAPHIEVRLPKIHGPADAHAALGVLSGRPCHALIESALGVEHAFAIAQSGVASIGLGEADLRSSLGLPPGPSGEPGLAWLRSRIVNAAAAAGLLPPLMSVYTNVSDNEGLRESCAGGRGLGFLGRAAIHPKQLAPIREAFTPTPDELGRAAETLARVGEAAADASGTVVLADGSFLDGAMVEAARRIVSIAQHTTLVPDTGTLQKTQK